MDQNTQQLMLTAGSSTTETSTYVEDVFSTWLYTGNGTTQTITNGIDLSGKGGLTWIKSRGSASAHRFVDTVRGATKSLDSSSASPSAAEITETTGLTSFSNSGFSIGADTDYNTNANTYASWTFRKAAKFFDVVTYTGTGANRTVAHSLGSVPGMILVKRTDAIADWQVYHRSLANTEYLVLNTTAAKTTDATRWNSATPTSTVFSLGTDATVNASGGTYVAYLFAHDAGGFGSNGADSIVSCGSYVGNGQAAGPVITLGWEPQWLLIKRADILGGSWQILDATRGLSVDSSGQRLIANTNGGEGSAQLVGLLPSGFRLTSIASDTNASDYKYIYIAIRRGPMKTPTDATKVFNAVARTGTGANATVACGFPADAFFSKSRNVSGGSSSLLASRLTGVNSTSTDLNAIETAQGATVFQANPWDVMDGFKIGTTSTQINSTANLFINYFLRRSPGFFDVVTYTGTGATLTASHNLGVTPELILLKRRNVTATDWQVYAGSASEYLILNSAAAKVTSNTDRWNNTAPTSSAFTVGTFNSVNTGTYIAYLFASCPGVSKVGSYTGTGTTLDVNCGFTNGARFVFIRQTNVIGGWFYYDTARGIIVANDPYLLLNTSAPETNTTDYIDPLASGFQITSNLYLNASGGTYLYLAIA
jgi:hypothetical protein